MSIVSDDKPSTVEVLGFGLVKSSSKGPPDDPQGREDSASTGRRVPPHQEGAPQAAARRALVLTRPAAFLTLVILSCIAMGLTIFWLLRSARV